MRFFTQMRFALISILLSLLYTFALAQVPDGYYSSAEGKSGAELKTALYNIIKGHTDFGYGGLYTTYVTSDNIVIDGQNRVYDMYSFKADGTAPYYFTNLASSSQQCGGSYSAEGDCYNREHTMPQSWFNEASPMKNDAHHVVPTDGKVNGIRSNYPHAEVGTASTTTKNGSKLGSCSTSGYSGTVFEPIDEFKGDFARMYLYMATRYEDLIDGWSGNGSASSILAGNKYPAYKAWYVALLLKWNEQDPVSSKEQVRNEAIYDRQGNRNPFIDNPDYAEMIWGSGTVNPLTFTSTAITAATVGMLYSYSVVAASSTSGASLSITAPTKPAWLAIASTGNGTATLGGTPTAAGSSAVVLQVSDGTNVKQQSFTIVVENAASTVSFTSTPITSAKVASAYSYSIVASSSTGTAATIAAVVKPSWLNLSASSNGMATLSGTPTADHIGNSSVQLKASNGTDSLVQSFNIVVADTASVVGGNLFTETFENMPAASSSYTNISWVGDNSFSWSATTARTDQSIYNRAVCLKNSGTPFIQSQTLTAGCSFVKLAHQQVFSGSGGVLTIFVNSTQVGTVDVTTDVQVDSFSVSVTGDFVIMIQSNGAARIKVDNVQWRSAEVNAGQKPTIANFAINPQSPTASQAVTVSATVTDVDGDLSTVALYWGLTDQSITNKVDMSANSSNFTGNIPAQVANCTVFYRIVALDSMQNEAQTDLQHYTVIGTSINKDILSKVKVYPNPVTGNLTVENVDVAIDNVEVFDMLGRRVYSVHNCSSQLLINFSNFERGVYFVKVWTNGIAKVLRAVKE